MEDFIREQAKKLGFDLVGLTALGDAETAKYFNEWIAAGHAADMHYLERGQEKRSNTKLPFDGVRSGIVVGMNYGGTEPAGPVARYARGSDYHDIMVDRLNELHKIIEAQKGIPIRGKAYVDTGPILERDLGRRAGLGWFGKNTLLINPKMGSFFFLGALFLDLELIPDEPFTTDLCGTCTRCLDACPTNAIVEPRKVDSNLCISYLTIELKGSIPENIRESIGDHVYGCDICQEVCPHVRKFSKPLTETAFMPREFIRGKSAETLSMDLLKLSQTEFSAQFKGSPMKRAKMRGLKRNAAVVLGNLAHTMEPDKRKTALELLTEVSTNADNETTPDPNSELLNEHAQWAIKKLKSHY